MVEVIGGPSARTQLALLRAYGVLAAPAHHRGMQKLSWKLGAWFNETNSVVIEQPVRMKIDLADGYWTRLLAPRYRYEPELETTLTRLLTPDTQFLDLGANQGYWSLMAARMTPHVVAVEAVPPTYERLRENCRLNGDVFRTLHAAIWHTDGEHLKIVTHTRRHAGASIIDRRDKVGQSGYTEHEVESMTIDTLADRIRLRPDVPTVIKLDVEGAETAALEGARSVLSGGNCVLLYEDHGQDAACAVSRALAEDHGMALFTIDSGVPQAVGVDEVAEMKKVKSRGYNFAAVLMNSPGHRQLVG